jgi:hypothetical protein
LKLFAMRACAEVAGFFGVVVAFVKNVPVFGEICGRWLFAVVKRDGEVARIL